jgi:hypothetical protein
MTIIGLFLISDFMYNFGRVLVDLRTLRRERMNWGASFYFCVRVSVVGSRGFDGSTPSPSHSCPVFSSHFWI